MHKPSVLSTLWALLPLSLSNIFSHKIRSLLTMLGIIVGIASVCSLMTLGSYTKEKILNSYADLGVNTFMFRGYPSWTMKATDVVGVMYQGFDWEKDLLPLKRIFPDIIALSPVLSAWDNSVTYAGKSIESDPRLFGISEHGLSITNRKLLAGRSFNRFHVMGKNAVCVIGYEIATRLFPNSNPLGEMIHVTWGNSNYGLKIIGVLAPKTSNNDWSKPNFNIFVPFTLFQTLSSEWWNVQIFQLAMEVRPGADIGRVGVGVRKFFERKYGKSGMFRADSDGQLLAQMKKFLDLFTVLLLVISLVSLVVGGVGIANMMLVSVSERIKEIGLRKAVGATNASIKMQFLLESIIICALAGVIGLAVGITAYHLAIWGASKLMAKIQFEWVFDGYAILLSTISIFVVGVVSGLIPAIKAEKLQVIEALRNE